MGGEVIWRGVDSLKPHPLNRTIYGEPELSEELVGSIRTRGILQPLRIATDGTVLAGHRRLMAAKSLGLESVPCQVHEGDDHVQVLVETNYQRDKTADQMARELMALKNAGVVLESDGGNSNREISPTVVGKKLGTPRRTAERIIDATEEIEQAISEGREDDAEEILDALKVSATSGHNKATQKRREREARDDRFIPIFALSAKFDAIAREIVTASKGIAELCQEDGGQQLVMIREEMCKRLEGIAERVRLAAPAIVCKTCNGSGCQECGHMGWINRGRIQE